ncbi:hypothetical protein TSOC_008193 [Tetrabaena socialis]|uniref:CAAX prenyl protease 2/Lysostaphin resistance protein A-like domain-containing protein n=1 Tax=Tetrabaena socialis TaxID=47790 RepID=A0A2J7ZZ39_9CHLO|nr:hypothetical protein TSOC_008193 [Tetrabaena socialis]|eukprot:PNH05537.1 hypothetical protein TSOC_008193 [Tetrabaena socialis]
MAALRALAVAPHPVPRRLSVCAPAARRVRPLEHHAARAAPPHAQLEPEAAAAKQAPATEADSRAPPSCLAALPVTPLQQLPQRTAISRRDPLGPLAPFPAVLLTVQAVCLNTVAGLSAMPLACAVAGGCSTGEAIHAPVPAVGALLAAAAAQAAGTWWLVGTELEVQQQREGRGQEPRPLDVLAGCRWTPDAFAMGAATAVVACCSVACCSIVLGLLATSTPVDVGNTQALSQSLHVSTAGDGVSALLLSSLVLSECVLTPLSEELLFREVLFRSLLAPNGTKRGGWGGPLVCQAAVFACYHFSASEWLPQFALGLALGAARSAAGGAVRTHGGRRRLCPSAAPDTIEWNAGGWEVVDKSMSPEARSEPSWAAALTFGPEGCSARVEAASLTRWGGLGMAAGIMLDLGSEGVSERAQAGALTEAGMMENGGGATVRCEDLWGQRRARAHQGAASAWA